MSATTLERWRDRRRKQRLLRKTTLGSSRSRRATVLSLCGIVPNVRITTGTGVHGKLELTPEEPLALEESPKQLGQGHFVDTDALRRELCRSPWPHGFSSRPQRVPQPRSGVRRGVGEPGV